MVNSGQVRKIRQLEYRPPDASRGQVETMPFQTLRELDDGATQRGDFHVLAVVQRGRGSVAIDFTTTVLEPQTVVSIRPGVVHRWIDIADLAGEVILFVPTAPTPRARALVDVPAAPSSWRAPDATWPLITIAVGHLRQEVGPEGPQRVTTDEVANLLLSALLVRLAPPVAQGQLSNEVFHRFQTLVEQQLHEHHDVGHFARALGYAPRTLSRAAHDATGLSAKAYLDERVLLEAKRLLAHDGLSPARCADRLGFPDASNFSAFFLRLSGERPGAWQTAQSEQHHRFGRPPLRS
jgi:AraC family transcriptional regulator, transcriptional activator of pobA